jgi:hypothetical protein
MKLNRPPRPVSIARTVYDRHGEAVMVLMNTMFVRHLIGVYRAFGGDPVAAIVLGEVAHHNLVPMVNRSRRPHELSETLRTLDRSGWGSLLPTNAFSIAQATGIPRETVRRKIASLTRRGWMVKDAGGNLFVSFKTHEAFAAFHVERLQDLLETARAIESLLDDGPAATDRPPKIARPRARAERLVPDVGSKRVMARRTKPQ